MDRPSRGAGGGGGWALRALKSAGPGAKGPGPRAFCLAGPGALGAPGPPNAAAPPGAPAGLLPKGMLPFVNAYPFPIRIPFGLPFPKRPQHPM